MSFIWLLFIICVVAIIPFVIWEAVDGWDNEIVILSIVVLSLIGAIVLACCIAQPILLKRDSIRLEKERQQIEYQIENLTSESDKVKLNECILTYNDWVNDVNTSKETYGYFSWYYSFDMKNHEIIQLV